MATFPDTQNRPTSPIVAPADGGDSTLSQFISGVNAGSCAPGIGIATAVVNPKESDWTRAANTPDSQYLGWGGDSTVTGQEAADVVPLLVADYEAPDFNDTAIFALADSAIAIDKGDVYDSVSGAILKSDLNAVTAVGDWIWGAVPAA